MQPQHEDEPVSVARKAGVYMLRQEYDSALVFLRAVSAQNSLNFEALYLQLAVLQTRLLDYESYHHGHPRFLRFADSVKTVFESSLKGKVRGHDSLWCLFYLGNTFGGQSIIQAKTGKWLAAGRNALKSVDLLKHIAQRDSTFYAAFLGTGVFRYYLSKYLHWLPGVQDQSKEGIQDIFLSTRSRFPYNFAAKESLFWILIDRKEFGLADSLVDNMLLEYPDNTIFLRDRGLTALWTGRWDRAIAAGDRLADRSRSRTPVNYSDLVLSYRLRAGAYLHKGMKDSCRIITQEVLSMTIPEPFVSIEPLRDNLKEIRDMADACN